MTSGNAEPGIHAWDGFHLDPRIFATLRPRITEDVISNIL